MIANFNEYIQLTQRSSCLWQCRRQALCQIRLKQT